MDSLDRLLSIAITGSLLVGVIVFGVWYVWDFVKEHGVVVLLIALMAAGFVAPIFAGGAGVFRH